MFDNFWKEPKITWQSNVYAQIVYIDQYQHFNWLQRIYSVEISLDESLMRIESTKTADILSWDSSRLREKK